MRQTRTWTREPASLGTSLQSDCPPEPCRQAAAHRLLRSSLAKPSSDAVSAGKEGSQPGSRYEGPNFASRLQASGPEVTVPERNFAAHDLRLFNLRCTSYSASTLITICAVFQSPFQKAWVDAFRISLPPIDLSLARRKHRSALSSRCANIESLAPSKNK